MASLPEGMTPYGRRATIRSHIRRLEAQIEAHVHRGNPYRTPESSEKAGYLLLSLPHDGYWRPFVGKHAMLYAAQVFIELDGGVPNFATWEDMVPLVIAHETARPFWWESIPLAPRFY